MKRKTKRILTFIFSLALVAAMSAQVLSAAVVDPGTQIQPMNYLEGHNLSIQFGETSLTGTAVFMGQSVASFVDARMELKKSSGADRGTVYGYWENLGNNSNTLVIFKTVNNIQLTAGTYRITVYLTTRAYGQDYTCTYAKDVSYTP